MNWSFLYLSQYFMCCPVYHEYFRKQRSLDCVNINQSFCINTEMDLWNFLSPWEKECSPRIQQRMFCGRLLHHLSHLPSRDPTRKIKFNCNEWTRVFVLMAELHIYSHAFLLPVLYMIHPVNVMLANGLLVVFPEEWVNYNTHLPKGDCHLNPRSTRI